ncbi:MAG: hypothetical protein KJ587_01430 [Alphaproteobacteria bacterium]|nr:hypothetical protein [Alphaproteobacteria bacterium]
MANFVRFLFGFVLACLAAALTQVLFVITPVDLYGLEGDARMEQAGRALAVALSAATQFAIFAAPFAAAAILFGIVQGLRGWAYYVFVGLAIALLGFAALYAGERSGNFTIANSYAVAAFAFSGIIAGYVYWLVAGRGSGPVREFADPLREAPVPETASRGHLKAKDYGGADETTGEPAITVPDRGLRKTH